MPWSIPHSSAAEFFIRLIPWIVLAFMMRLPCTRPWYEALSSASLMPLSPITVSLRRTRKAVTRVDSLLAGCAQKLTTDLMAFFSCFRNENRNNSRGVRAEKDNKREATTEKEQRR